jgi:predicted RNA polymerase sigma factor
VAPGIKHSASRTEEIDVDMSTQNINDSQLQMMFAVCHPCIPVESQIGLSLNILCGFGAEEIADAFLSNKETIYKRLTRAKEKLRTEKVAVELPPAAEIGKRLDAVLTTLYLLFSEGYYSGSQNIPLRKDFCLEAMRLNLLLTEHPQTNTPLANALLSLMCFHSSRFEARTDQKGDVILYEEQNEELWNRELIARGEEYLNRASQGNTVSKYLLEAAIAYCHTHKSDTAEKWENILQLYNRLLQLNYSTIAALNRTYALAKARGNEMAIAEAEKLELTDNHLYHSLLANLYSGTSREQALLHLEQALALAKTAADKNLIAKQIEKLSSTGSKG